MKVSTDDRCRLESRELFKPNTRYEGERKTDGSVRLWELTGNSPARAHLVRRDGRTYLESERQFSDADVRAVLEDFP